MPSSSRRRFLQVASAASLSGIAGCSTVGSTRPDLNSATGLLQDTSHALEDESVYMAGDDNELQTPPKTVESVADADAVLAAANADRTHLKQAIHANKPVAVAGNDAISTMRGLLASLGAEYSFGFEMVRARPVKIVVADPRQYTVDTYTFVAEGGWDEPILDPFGWALNGRIPECDTFVPESSMDTQFAYAGAAHIAGRLPTGETYATRSEASVSRQDAGRYVRLQTKLHTAANDGYAIEEVVREADLPDDQRLNEIYPNPHTKQGVQLSNVSDTIRSTFAIELTPDSPRARSALTGCGGFRTEGKLAYDHRSSFQWKRDGLFDKDRHYGGATGRGEWIFSE